MKHFIFDRYFWVWRFLPGLVLVVACLMLLVRFALPAVAHYKNDLVDGLSNYLGTPVAVQRIQAEWLGFGPVVHLQGMALGEGENQLWLEQSRLDWDYRGLRLTLDNLQIGLIRTPEGAFKLQGLPFTSSSDQSFDLPFSQLALRNATLRWHDQRQSAPPLVLSNVQLNLRQSDGRTELHLQFDNEFGQLDLTADIQGDLAQGLSYLDWRGLPLARVLTPYLPVGYPLQSGDLDIRLWQEWRDGLPLSNQASMQLSDVQMTRQMQPQRIEASLNLHRLAQDIWRLDLTDVQLNGESDRFRQIALQHRAMEQGAQLDLAAEQLDVQAIVGFVRDIVPTDLKPVLSGLNPQGRLHNTRMQALLNAGELQHWTLNAGFDQVSVDTWDGIPGLSAMQGEIAMQPGRAMVRLAAENTRIESPRLFRQPIGIKRLSTVLYAVADAQRDWRIQADDVDLATVDFASRGKFRLLLSADRPPYLDIRANATHVPVGVAANYVPLERVEPELIEWLDMALLEGWVEQANVLLSGPLDTFPYHETRNGVFEVISHTSDIKLKYRPGWPVLHVDKGLVHFHQNSMDAELLAGGLYNSQATGHVHIASLDPTSALIAQGKAYGPLQDVLNLLREDALKENFAHIADLMRLEGDGDTALNLSVPIVAGRSELGVQGKINFAGNSLHLPGIDLSASDIHGELALQQTSLYAKDIRATALGTPVRVDIQPQAGNNQIKVAGKVSPGLLKKVAANLPLEHIKGAAEAELVLNLPGLRAADGKTKPALTVQSNLHGLQIDLPPPFGKTARAKRPLLVQMALNNKSAPVYLTYANKLRAIVTQDGQRADVRYRSGAPQLPRQGYRVKAAFDRLDLADWQSMLQMKPKQQGAGAPWQVQVQADQLDFKALHLTQAMLLVEQNTDGLRGQIDTHQIKGSFFYPQGNGEPVSVHLDKAYIDWRKPVGRQPLPTDFGPDPRELPAIRLICDDLRINQAIFGQLVLDSRKTLTGLRLDKVLIAGPHISLNAQGNWFMRDVGPFTQLEGKFHANDLGDFLHTMGFQRNLHQAGTDVSFVLNWPGHPLQMRKETISGSAHLLVGAGRLSELEPGLVKVLGLLNLDVLSRRLQLNFDDLLEEGYSFDRMEGDFTFAQGNAKTRNLRVLGPTSHIQIGGRIGFIERDFDSLVYVTPELDGTLLLAGALAGGPVVGLGTLLVQQLLNDEVNDFSRFEYSVTGSWDDPQLKPLDAGVLSGLVNAISGEESQNKTDQQEEMIDADTTAKRGFLERLLETIQSGEVEDDPLFEELD